MILVKVKGDNMYKDLVIGSRSLVELNNKNRVHYINFDNAATTPPFRTVMNRLNSLAPIYSSVHRGTGQKSIISSKLYEKGRRDVLDFIKANERTTMVIFLKNTTECINKLSYRLKPVIEDKVVLITYMEHHSNMLPWRERYKTDYVDIDLHGRLDLNDLELKLKKYKGDVKLVCVAAASNVTGYVNPVHDIAAICHKYGALILVDGAQAVPHMSFDMKDDNDPQHIDFLAFSAHKMYAPFGTGALITPKNIFIEGSPEMVGGGTVQFVSADDVIWAYPPEKEEAGTPNLMGVEALSESIRTINSIGMGNIEAYEKDLLKYAYDRIIQIPNIVLYDDGDTDRKVSLISFNIAGLHHSIVAQILGEEGGIAVRNGCFCAQPYVQRLLWITRSQMESYRSCPKMALPGMVRVSFGIYNDYNEIDLFIYMLEKIANNIPYYQNKYKNPTYE